MHMALGPNYLDPIPLGIKLEIPFIDDNNYPLNCLYIVLTMSMDLILGVTVFTSALFISEPNSQRHSTM